MLIYTESKLEKVGLSVEVLSSYLRYCYMLLRYV